MGCGARRVAGHRGEAAGPGLLGFARLLVRSSVVLLLGCTGCIYGRLVYFNTPTLEAPTYFDSRTIEASRTPERLPARNPELPIGIRSSRSASYASFDELLEDNETRAFLVLHRGRIVYERYFGDVTSATLLPGFSMSKSYAALVVGCAVSDGLFGSMDDSILEYVPELERREGYENIRLDHLLRMISGIDFDEESTAGAILYYSTDLRERMYEYDVKWHPGSRYLYGSVSIQLLWSALNARLGGESVSHYFERRIWQPLGAEHAATWSLDSSDSGVEKFFGGFNATARDHARLGLLFLNGGSWGDRVVVPRSWVARSLSVDPIPGVVRTTDGNVHRGKYQWFLMLDGRAYFAKGYNGQYVFVMPKEEMVFVRFGEGYGDVDWPALFETVAALSSLG